MDYLERSWTLTDSWVMDSQLVDITSQPRTKGTKEEWVQTRKWKKKIIVTACIGKSREEQEEGEVVHYLQGRVPPMEHLLHLEGRIHICYFI